MKRRGFLAATGAALVCAPNVAGAKRERRIAIVGAGIAGLAAARALADRGVHATVFEARQRVGGRMHSERAYWGNGQVSEYGGELIDTAHTTMRALVKRFGLQLADVLAGDDATEQTIRVHGAYYAERRLYADFRPVYRTLVAQVAACGRATTYARATAAGRALDATSVAQWIARFVPGGRRSNLGTYVERQYVAEYGVAAEEQSALNLVYWLGRQPDYDEKTGAFNALGPSDERFHVVGGNDRLPRAIANSLRPQSVRLEHVLEAIERRSDGAIALVFATPDGSRRETFDTVICTIPFSVLRHVDTSRADFDALKRAAIAELGYGDHSKLIVQFDERYWRTSGAWPGISAGDATYDGAFGETWEASRAQPGRTGMIVDFAAAEQSARMPSDRAYTTAATEGTGRYARAFARELEAVWPGATRLATGKATLSHMRADPYARGSYSVWLRGQYVRFGGYEGVRQGNVHFAGEHCSIPYQGFMEGAAREGIRAASEID